jgi:hypothetical protein
MVLRLTDMRDAVLTGTPLIPFGPSTFRAGAPDIGEPEREIRIDQKFLTFPGEVTNADVSQIARPLCRFSVNQPGSDHSGRGSL